MVIFMMRILNFLLCSFSIVLNVRSAIFSNVYEMYLGFGLPLQCQIPYQRSADSQLREYYLTTTRYSAQILLPFNWTIEITFHQEFLLGLSVSHLTRHMLLGSLSLNTYTEITPHLTKMSHCSSSSLALLGFLTTNKNYMFVLVKKQLFTLPFVQPMDSFCQEKEGIWKMILK